MKRAYPILRKPDPQEISQAMRRVLTTHPVGLYETISRRWKRRLPLFLRQGGCSDGNRLTLYWNPDYVFTEKWESISEARRLVLWSAFTVEPDLIGRASLRALASAKRSGCQTVCLMYDPIGSPKFDDYDMEDLRTAGAFTIPFNALSLDKFSPLARRIFMMRPLRRTKKGHPFLRNHQKILIADDVAFTGGMNISTLYAGPREGGSPEGFIDAHIKIEGPAVKDLQKVFLHSIEKSNHPQAPIVLEKIEEVLKEDSPPVSYADGAFVQVCAPRAGGGGLRSIQKNLRRALRTAIHNVYITTPYFLPPNLLRRELIRAVRRGVDVRILTAGHSDLPTMRYASKYIYEEFIKHGVRIFELFGPKPLHAKIATMDGIYCYCGSFNLDHWSDTNLEVNLTIIDPEVACVIHEQFLEAMENSQEVTLKDISSMFFLQKLFSWLCYGFYSFFGPTFFAGEEEGAEELSRWKRFRKHMKTFFQRERPHVWQRWKEEYWDKAKKRISKNAQKRRQEQTEKDN